MRVTATAEAERTVRQVQDSGRGDLVMVLGTGCCDSTAPFLYDHYDPGPDAVRVGHVAGVPVMAPRWLENLYRAGPQLVIDVVVETASDSFSLESELGRRFTLRYPATATARQPEPADRAI